MTLLPIPDRFEEFDPTAASKFYIFDFTQRFDRPGLTLEDVEWDIFPEGPTLSDGTFTDTHAKIYVSDGTSGVDYRLICKPVTNDPLYNEPLSIIIRCRKT